MTNQQGAPEALRTIRRFYRGNDCMAENQAGDWVRYEDHVAAMVKAQQPAPSEQQPFGWIKQSEIDSSNDFGGSINLWRRKYDCDVPVYLAQQPAPSAAVVVQKIDRGFRWDGEKQQHIPTLLIEFEPVPANSPCDAKGWQDRDALADLLSPTPQADSQPAPAMDESYKQAVGSKNCMQCCVSYMLGLPLESVPDFATAGGWDRFASFAESQGYAAVMLPGNHEFEADYLASGTTERGTQHMVVMHDGKLAHDPHPSNAGLVEVQCVWLLAKKSGPQRHHDERAAFEASAKAYTSNVSFERDEHDYADMTASLLWHGWKLRAARAPADGQPAPVREYPPLPMQFACSGVFPVYSADQMRAYIDADRAARAPADSVTAPAGPEDGDSLVLCASDLEHSAIYDNHVEMQSCLRAVAARVRSLAYPTPPAQAADSVLEDADPIRALIAEHAAILDQNESAYFELCYHRATGWMAWITDKPLCMPPVVNPDRKVLAQGQGDTADEACRDAARKQGDA